MDNILALVQIKNVKQYAEETACRAKQMRQQAKLTQTELSEQAGLPLSTYKRFEQKGLISFDGLIQVAIALRSEQGLDGLFAPKINETEFTSLADVEKKLIAPSVNPQKRGLRQ